MGPSWQEGITVFSRDSCCTIILFQMPRLKGLDKTA